MTEEVVLSVDQTEEKLLDMLRADGINPAAADPYHTWKVFKHFCHVPVNCADDGILFETHPSQGFAADPNGLYDAIPPSFTLHFLRQFSLEENGEYSGMQQLDCRFEYDLTDDLRLVQKVVWAYDFDTIDAFFAHVESLPHFRAVEGYGARRTDVQQGDV